MLVSPGFAFLFWDSNPMNRRVVYKCNSCSAYLLLKRIQRSHHILYLCHKRWAAKKAAATSTLQPRSQIDKTSTKIYDRTLRVCADKHCWSENVVFSFQLSREEFQTFFTRFSWIRLSYCQKSFELFCSFIWIFHEITSYERLLFFGFMCLFVFLANKEK